ncbi:MAG: hypothetical protein MO853_14365 [Candidatus Protistobacter heckmanni]|nr:hypothetical protein [Candidatus Protistobacter heckmanni]MCS6764894.1 hypothetical protein [Candidatus Protistobacter heckmanni]
MSSLLQCRINNDHPAIREVFSGPHLLDLEIKYSVANLHGEPQASGELVLTTWEVGAGQLFY